MRRISWSTKIWNRPLLNARAVYLVGPAVLAWLGLLVAAGSSQGCMVEAPAHGQELSMAGVQQSVFARAPCAPFDCRPERADAEPGRGADASEREGDRQELEAAVDGADTGADAGADHASESPFALHDAACQARDGCKWAGRCIWSPQASDCVAGEHADCKASGFCRLLGRCSLDGEECRAGGDADCAQSEACELSGACWYRNGACKKESAE